MAKDSGPSRTSTAPTASSTPGARLPVQIWVLVVAAFVIALGYGLVAPALPTFARSFDVGVTAASFVISSFAVFRLSFAPISGRLVNSFGELRVYLIGLFIVALSTGACAFAQAYWQLLLFRSLGGIGSTMFTVSSISLLVRLAPPALRGRASGLWATGFLLGNIAGPVVGGGLVAFSLRAPFLVYAVVLVVAAAIAGLLLRGSRSVAVPETDDRVVVPLRTALANRTYRAALTSSFANGWTVFGVRVALMPLFVVEVLREQPSWAGIALAVFAAGNAVTLMLSGRIADSRGRRPPVLVGLVISASGTIWLGFTGGLALFLVASLVTGIGSGLVNPAMSAAVADVIGNRGRGGPVLAGFQMAADLGAIIGPVLAGAVAQFVSYQAAFGITGLVSAGALLFWWRAPETLPSRIAAVTVRTADADTAATFDATSAPVGTAPVDATSVDATSVDATPIDATPVDGGPPVPTGEVSPR